MAQLSYVAEQVRVNDHDRFLTSIFAPASVREHLLTLYAFNLEVAKVAEMVREPLIGHMRLQWWRDVLDTVFQGGTVAHPVVEPLGRAIRAGQLPREPFDRLIDSREFDLEREAPADMAALESYAEGTGAPLMALALALCGASGSGVDAAARLVGTAWSLIGLIRAVPFHAGQHRVYLPRDRLEAAGLQPEALWAQRPDERLAQVVREIGGRAAALLESARRPIGAIPKASRAPLLVVTLGGNHLADLRKCDWNPFDERVTRGRPLAALGLAVRSLWAGY